MTMKRRRNPEVPTPVIVAASLAAGGALAWWYFTRSATSAVQPLVTAARQFIDPVTGAAFTPTPMGPIIGGIPSLSDASTVDAVLARAQAAAGRPLTRIEQAAALSAAGVAAQSFEPNREYLA